MQTKQSKKAISPYMISFLSAFAGTLLFLQTNAYAASGVRFSGGLCSSQGSWLQTALENSNQISNAIYSLKNDENCKALVAALERSPKVDQKEKMDNPDAESYAHFHRELSALSDYLKPERRKSDLENEQFKDLVYQVVFSKSFDAIKSMQGEGDFAKLTDAQRTSVFQVGYRLRTFLDRSAEIANITMETAQNIVSALPESQLCMHNKPNQAAVIFSSVVHSAASLLSGGKINGVGQFLSTLMNYTRDMSYINALSPLERDRFNASVSCLVESTSEAYCAIEDAEDSIGFMRGVVDDAEKKKLLKKIISNEDADPVANPIGGLTILMRDIPIIQNWLQRVIFGNQPRLSVEATMKNSYWDSLISFIKSVNSLQGDFRDKEQLYLTRKTSAREAKLSRIKDIHDSIIGNTIGKSPLDVSSGSINFFTNVMSAEKIKFYLIGVDQLPDMENKTFDDYFNEWTDSQENGFNDPDRLLGTMRTRFLQLIELAKVEANSFFAERMISDPQNLIAEAMKGPGVSPYQAFIHLKVYFNNLSKKLALSIEKMGDDHESRVRKKKTQSMIPMLRGSAKLLDKIIKSLESAADLGPDLEEEALKKANSEIMNIIYETADMLNSRDSLFGNRARTAVQVDLSDTLYTQKNLNEAQKELLFSMGSEIVQQLSNRFSQDPSTLNLDLSHAKVVQITNLQTTEQLFAKVLFDQILDLKCKVSGGFACQYSSTEIDPTKNTRLLRTLNEGLMREKMTAKNPQGSETGGFFKRLLGKVELQNSKAATEDSDAHTQLISKLCIQSLAFQSRQAFVELCSGSKLESIFVTKNSNNESLNMNYDSMMSKITDVQKSNIKQKIDTTRNIGVCAFRSYIRKNHIFYMYKDYLGASE